VSFRITDSLNWIARALGIDRTSSYVDVDQPATVLDTIQPVVTAQGWQATLRRGSFAVTQAGATNIVTGPTPAIDEAWLVFACAVFHTDAGAKSIRIEITDTEQNSIVGEVAILRNTAAQQNVHEPIERPVLLNHGQRLRAVSIQAIPIGQSFQIRGHFLRLAVGEYVPGAPYG
jgi:hypothetical protein